VNPFTFHGFVLWLFFWIGALYALAYLMHGLAYLIRGY